MLGECGVFSSGRYTCRCWEGGIVGCWEVVGWWKRVGWVLIWEYYVLGGGDCEIVIGGRVRDGRRGWA